MFSIHQQKHQQVRKDSISSNSSESDSDVTKQKFRGDERKASKTENLKTVFNSEGFKIQPERFKMQDGTNFFLSNCCPIGVGSLDGKVLGSVHFSLKAININGGRGRSSRVV